MQDEAPGLIGFVGIGIMGRPMAARLLQAGYELLVWNRTPGRCEELLDLGAEESDSLADLVDNCELILLCLSDADAVESVVFGPGGIAELADEEQILVDLSTIGPGPTRRMASALESACGMAWIDAPVSGGPEGAANGTLTILAGGFEEAFDRVLPVLECLGRNVTRLGPTGSGQLAKVCNQVMVCGGALLVAEAIALAERAGMDAEILPEALAGGLADTPLLRLLGPRMAVRGYEPVLARLGTMQKDLEAVLAVAREADVALPLSALASELVRQHRARAGDESDASSVIELYNPES